MLKTLAFAIFRDLGFSRKSSKLRVDLLLKMAECERLGIDPFAEFRKSLEANGFDISLPAFPGFTISIPLD